MKIIKISLPVSVFVVLNSCTFLRYVQGTVIDEESRLPIGSVKIGEENSPDFIANEDGFVYTDSLGSFEIFSPTAGLFICPKTLLSFEKKGYKKAIKKYGNWNGNVVVVLGMSNK